MKKTIAQKDIKYWIMECPHCKKLFTLLVSCDPEEILYLCDDKQEKHRCIKISLDIMEEYKNHKNAFIAEKESPLSLAAMRYKK